MKIDIYFTAGTVIRGYHVYKEIWESSIGEMLDCGIEDTNRYDCNAVAVVKT